MAEEFVLEVRGLDGATVRSWLAEMGGKQCSPRRIRGRGWTAVMLEETIGCGPFHVDRVLMHLLGAPGPVQHVIHRLYQLTGTW